jgi:DNA-binding transcriptional LysR family regulator
VRVSSYLKTRGTPQHPDDLVQHECLVMRYGLTTDREWPFLIDGKERRIIARGHRIANDGELVRVWCRNGLGIARKSRLDVEADLKTGNLVEVLQDFSSGDTALQIVYPATQAQPKRVRLLIERIAEAFAPSGSK